MIKLIILTIMLCPCQYPFSSSSSCIYVLPPRCRPTTTITPNFNFTLNFVNPLLSPPFRHADTQHIFFLHHCLKYPITCGSSVGSVNTLSEYSSEFSLNTSGNLILMKCSAFHGNTSSTYPPHSSFFSSLATLNHFTLPTVLTSVDSSLTCLTAIILTAEPHSLCPFWWNVLMGRWIACSCRLAGNCGTNIVVVDWYWTFGFVGLEPMEGNLVNS